MSGDSNLAHDVRKDTEATCLFANPGAASALSRALCSAAGAEAGFRVLRAWLFRRFTRDRRFRAPSSSASVVAATRLGFVPGGVEFD